MHKPLPPGPERTPSQIITEARDLWWSNLPVLVWIGVIFTAPFVVISFMLTLGMSEAVVDVDGKIDVLFETSDDRDLHRMLTGTLAIADVLAGLMAWGAMASYLWRRRTLEPVDWRDAVRVAVDRFGVLLRVAMIEFLIVVLGAILLIAVFSVGIPGLIAALALAAAVFIRVWVVQVVVIVEGEQATEALRRSWDLVTGRARHALGTLLFAVLRLLVYGLGFGFLVFFLTLMVEAAAGPIPTLLWFAISQLGVSALLSPFVVAAAVPLYVDLRRRQEAEGSPPPPQGFENPIS